MNVREALQWGSKLVLKASESNQLDCQIILAFVLGENRSFLFAHPEKPLSYFERTSFENLMQDRLQGKPVAYITGKKSFYNLELMVDENVLIPRPETEMIVDWVLDHFPQENILKVADLGTGSGAIALAIGKARPHWQIVAIDKSPGALSVARKNAQALEVQNLTFCQSDWGTALKEGVFDCIVSNPPYVSSEDPCLKTGSHLFEPKDAFDGGKDGGLCLDLVVKESRRHLKFTGWLAVEHGSNQEELVNQLFRENDYKNIACLKDLNKYPRITVGLNS